MIFVGHLRDEQATYLAHYSVALIFISIMKDFPACVSLHSDRYTYYALALKYGWSSSRRRRSNPTVWRILDLYE